MALLLEANVTDPEIPTVMIEMASRINTDYIVMGFAFAFGICLVIWFIIWAICHLMELGRDLSR